VPRARPRSRRVVRSTGNRCSLRESVRAPRARFRRQDRGESNFIEGSRVFRKGDLLVKFNDARPAGRAGLACGLSRWELAERREGAGCRAVETRVSWCRDKPRPGAKTAVKRPQGGDRAWRMRRSRRPRFARPFDGHLRGLRYVKRGARSWGAATRIATLQRIDRLKVDFAVPEKYAERIRLGSPVLRSRLGGRRGASSAAKCMPTNPRIDADTRHAG